jgi:hypothetical protein
LYRPGTSHSGVPHRRKYDPARQRNSQEPSTLKINKTRDECNKEINTLNTAYIYKEKVTIPPEEKQYYKERKST